MVANQHFQRLKHIYTADSPDEGSGNVSISYGCAEIDGVIEDQRSGDVLNRMPHQRLLSDAASLAAGSLDKQQLLTAERFNVRVEQPAYRGPVVAVAEVIVAEPPRYHVQTVLLSESDEIVAEAIGIFEPSGEELPPDPSPGKDDEEKPVLPPAAFMPVFSTPYGALCLN